MKQLLFTLLLLLNTSVFATTESTDTVDYEKFMKELVERDKNIKYQTGKIDINSEIEINVPAGFKFMPKKDAEYVIFDYWGNPKTDDVLGMIVKDNFNIIETSHWAFVVTYENAGYVKDEDAEKIDYDEMMKGFHEDEAEENKNREKEGYPSIHIIDWATKPFYDKSNNILHWAKSIKFGNSEDTTLNYDVRILGRKGILSLNAVGVINQLEDIKSNIPSIIHIAKFKKGSSYLDFDPSVDKVAAYTLGGLVAGKILAKAGIIALILKNIKLIIIGILALFGGLKNKILGLFGRKPEETTQVVEEKVEEKNEEETNS